jgi:phage tail protein X
MDYMTKENDTVDLICYRIYGHHNNGITDKVIRKNIKVLTKEYEDDPVRRGLRAGILLDLPDKAEAGKAKKVRRLF